MDLNLNEALFLDRDNTIIYDAPYMADPDKVRIMPGVIDALCEFRKAGYLLIIITNQSGIARGCFNEKEMHAVNKRMRDLFEAENIFFDDILFCPHSTEDSCACRKPKPGMLIAAAVEHNIDIADSVMVGDKISDIEAGIAAGCKTNIWLSYGRDKIKVAKGDFLIANDMSEAAEIVLLK